MNISLPDPLKAWVEAQAESGRSSNASDYVRDLIRKDRDERAQKHDAPQRMITESRKSGEARSLDMAAFKKRMRGAHGKKSR